MVGLTAMIGGSERLGRGGSGTVMRAGGSARVTGIVDVPFTGLASERELASGVTSETHNTDDTNAVRRRVLTEIPLSDVPRP